MGTMANELSLGCDCLGQIHYLVNKFPFSTSCMRFIPPSSQPGTYVTHNGSVAVIKNAICIHEEDAGVLWKHQDCRPGGRGRTVRARRLVISMICTLANYGKIF
jgi:primary-amine oxidase